MKLVAVGRFKPSLLPVLLLLLCSTPKARLDEQPQPQQSHAKGELQASPAHAILQHQEALARECAKYQDELVRQLEYLNSFQANNDHLLHLASPLSVKVPAVCLFLFSQFGGQTGDGTAQPWSAAGRLELVNWIFNYEPAHNKNNNNNLTKRQTGEIDLNGDAHSELLAEYLLHPERSANNEIDTDGQELAGAKVRRHQVDQVMADKRFHEPVASGRANSLLSSHLSPVVLVPGLLGSRLQVRTNKVRRVNLLCSKQSNWQDIWLSLRHLLPLLVDCWLDNVRLEYDPSSGWTRSPAGIEPRVPDFGSVESVRHLDLRQPKMTGYFSTIIDHYQQLGYTPDKNLLAAPYDFRLAPQELTSYFMDLKRLVEQAQSSSPSGKRVTLVCHSMGCTHLLVFLRLQSSAWRQKRIRKLIALSSPWGGATKALKALLVGDSLDLPLVSELKMRTLARNYPSIAYLLPQAEVFERPNKNRAEAGGPVLVQTPERNYRARDIEQLLLAANLSYQLDWFNATSALIKPLEPLPDLEVDCIHSLNTPTPESIIFKNQTDFPDGHYELVKGDGDGTVNLESLLVCELWASKLPDKVRHKVIMNTNHLGVLSHKTTLTHITDDVLITD